MNKIEYPKWKYHPEKEALIVEDAQAEKALGSGWVNSPAEFEVEAPLDLTPIPQSAKRRKTQGVK